jgi:hypothetical protein
MSRLAKHIVRAALCCLVSVLGFPPPAAAQDCVGFTDVPASSPFCPNVEWLKNRGVTIGCSSSTLYCPNDIVTRLSMAVFMNRLGKVLTPEVLAQDEAFGVLAIPPAGTPGRVCETAATTSTLYPRSATVHGTLTGLVNGLASWRGGLAVRINGGAWVSVPASEFRASATDNWSFTAPDGTIAVQPGNSVQVALTIQRDDVVSGTTGNFLSLRCQIVVEVDNQNGSTSPYDPSLAGVAP